MSLDVVAVPENRMDQTLIALRFMLFAVLLMALGVLLAHWVIKHGGHHL